MPGHGAHRIARYMAVGGGGAAALLYLLIGFGVLYVGRSTTGGDADLFGFGLTAGATFAVLATVVTNWDRRAVVIPIALFDAIVIVAYFAMAGLREPPFELWGLAVKAAQVVMLVGLVMLVVLRHSTQPQQAAPRTRPLAGTR